MVRCDITRNRDGKSVCNITLRMRTKGQFIDRELDPGNIGEVYDLYINTHYIGDAEATVVAYVSINTNPICTIYNTSCTDENGTKKRTTEIARHTDCPKFATFGNLYTYLQYIPMALYYYFAYKDITNEDEVEVLGDYDDEKIKTFFCRYDSRPLTNMIEDVNLYTEYLRKTQIAAPIPFTEFIKYNP